MRRFIPFVGDTRASDAWEELFSREVLGAVLVGSAAGKVVEKVLNLLVDTTVELLIAWSFAVVVGMLIFVYWHRIEAAAEDATDAATGKS
jgi:hypothetical protein